MICTPYIWRQAMRNLWVVIAMEWRLQLRGKGAWFLAALMAVSSVYVLFQASLSHTHAANFWPNMGAVYLFLTFGLVFMSGDQIQRDRECRVDGILLSAPISTATYVTGKYLASCLLLLGLALLNLLITLAGDALLPASGGAVIGPGPYVATWCVLALVPLVFGAAFTLLITTLTRGQRVVTGLLLFLLWLGPFFILFTTGRSVGLVDVLTVTGWLPLSTDAAELARTASPSQEVQLVQIHIPWDHLTSTLWLNRASFLLLAALCFVGAIATLHAQRRGAPPHVHIRHADRTKGIH
jgi:ABC-type transport system involved in multi-copper enzyme maturation permease subunit